MCATTIGISPQKVCTTGVLFFPPVCRPVQKRKALRVCCYVEGDRLACRQAKSLGVRKRRQPQYKSGACTLHIFVRSAVNTRRTCEVAKATSCSHVYVLHSIVGTLPVGPSWGVGWVADSSLHPQQRARHKVFLETCSVRPCPTLLRIKGRFE